MSDEHRNTTTLERLADALRTRREILAAGIGVVGLAIGSGLEEVSGRNRAKRRRRRRRRGGGGGGLGGDGCIVCASGCPFTSIQTALEALSGFGAQLNVCAGTFRERITFNAALQNGVTILGAGVGSTIIDADGDGPAVTVDSRTIATLRGVTITGGKAAMGGGIVNRGRLTLQDVNVTKNSNGAADGGGGGGIYNASGALLTLDTTGVTENNALDGQGGGILNAGTAVLQENAVVSNNMADRGGGIFNLAGGVVSVGNDSRVSNNEPDNCVGTSAC